LFVFASLDALNTQLVIHWRLALIDNIGNGLSKSELKQLRETIDFDLNFDEILIISNIHPTLGEEL